jgi:hypothetical protein
MGFTLFKGRAPKGFDMTPRFYDERKEDLERRIRLKKKELELEDKLLSQVDENDREVIRERIRNEWKTIGRDQSSSNNPFLIRIAIGGVLFLILYAFFFTDLMTG